MRLELSTRPDKRIGADELWDAAEAALHAALERAGVEYELNEGDGAFYGPKIDLHMTDSIGRSWQMGTIQLDFQMPERFGITYTGEDNAEHTPAMIHRALFGSFERFIGILIEHYAYVIVAIPMDSNTGTRSFCSTSDGLIRYKTGESIAPPAAAAECKAWPRLQ